jgi:hypothetical protein
MPQNNELEYFIDSHCHMFTIADIPIYQTMKQAAHDKLGLPTRILLPLVSFALPLIDPAKKVEKLEKFMRYFENEPHDSVAQLCGEVAALVAAQGRADYSFAAAKTILTPLVMDMDLGGGIGSEKQSKLAGQVTRLTEAIRTVSPTNVTVLPFIGIDPERKRPDFDYWLGKAVSVAERGGIANAKNGDFIGIKFYPSLGFSPQEHVEKYRAIAAKGLPVTVHCQKDALKLVDKANSLIDPKNWEVVLATMSGDAHKLKINFAHFGGEDSVKETAYIRERIASDGAVMPNIFDSCRKNSWTRSIIRMLKVYPDAYSDLSAYDFDDPAAVASLKWIFHLDSKGEFTVAGAPNPPLIEKLMWGSDYPMTLKGGDITYSDIFGKFIEAMKRTKDKDGQWEYPPIGEKNALSDTEISKLVCDNPRKFLGI